MKKIRINELARELEVKAHEILDRLPELGVSEKKTHSSSIDEDVAIKLRRLYGFDVPDAEPEPEGGWPVDLEEEHEAPSHEEPPAEGPPVAGGQARRPERTAAGRCRGEAGARTGAPRRKPGAARRADPSAPGWEADSPAHRQPPAPGGSASPRRARAAACGPRPAGRADATGTPAPALAGSAGSRHRAWPSGRAASQAIARS